MKCKELGKLVKSAYSGVGTTQKYVILVKWGWGWLGGLL